ncbi:MAG TPA: amino acid permease [Candidatus Aminicenantes bacterium]|nr:amino acid permease [Candidatus Aminicenantes bacterium]HRY64732.1 amino acid permease [Candidatus Aminicenantes bacterium]HRZ71645.1 amino acid permease [Candidatus Aminicenantes bacterium]
MSIKAKLTTFDATMIVVSLIIGIGIFRTPAMVAAAAKTPALFYAAWGLGGLVSLLGALTFAEIGGRFAKPGSYYKVVAENYGSGLAFMLNWTNVVILNGAGAAGVALIGAEYLTPIVFPGAAATTLRIEITAVILILGLLVVNFLGIKTGAWAQNVLSVLKVVMIGVLAAAAFLSKKAPAGPAALPLDKPWFFALGVAFIYVFYAYGGYQNTINFGADVHNARRNVPRAVFFGILVVLACYLTINVAYVKTLGVPGIAGAKLVAAETARVTLGETGKLFVSLAIFLSAMGFLNVTLMQIPRVYYSMAEDRTLPAVFQKVNPRTQAQEFGLLFLGAIILVSIFLLRKFENIVNYVMFLDTITLAVVSSTLFVLRRKARASGEPYAGYRVPLYPVLPGVFIAVMLAVAGSVLATQTREALYGAIFFAVGFPVFLLMRRVSRRQPDEPPAAG